MKNQFNKRKEFVPKAGFFSMLALVLVLISFSAYSQTIPSVPLHNPVNKEGGKDTTRYLKQDTSHPRSDGVKKIDTPHELSPAEIKKIVGNDKPMGKNTEGHQLYQYAQGKTYYLDYDGTKVYPK